MAVVGAHCDAGNHETEDMLKQVRGRMSWIVEGLPAARHQLSRP